MLEVLATNTRAEPVRGQADSHPGKLIRDSDDTGCRFRWVRSKPSLYYTSKRRKQRDGDEAHGRAKKKTTAMTHF
jgi:hypothetical protein